MVLKFPVDSVMVIAVNKSGVQGVVAHAFNFNTWEAEADCEFKTSLVYIVEVEATPTTK